LSVVNKLLGMFEVHPYERLPDPLSPRPRDLRWELQVGLALAILLIIGMMIISR
jgi:hypothetical protein